MVASKMPLCSNGSTLARILMPVAITMPKMTMPAPPNTNCGTEATTTDILGIRPNSTRIAPAVTHTQWLRTPVTPTKPIFCEDEQSRDTAAQEVSADQKGNLIFRHACSAADNQ